MEIRGFQDSDIEEIITLFYDAVHTVNSRDYTREQLDAWAPAEDMERRAAAWLESMAANFTLVAVIEGALTGFADMTEHGHLERLFVHKDYQGRGIASVLVGKLEGEAGRLGLPTIDTDASVTARPFFERRGYVVVKEQAPVRNGIALRNYKMIKSLS
ncbi:acetyltransferase [Paenibacillus agaridevorans]|uniref:Acetyltransferase n=1 Tax=Paenibacillus agaridevorans TaxID=171404 RepID=A0A2R5EVY9_9BACL|nr:GNAT family N-acetyltransferase [Paenibacillus agaridevorans]GBG10830.1 acetyltransferase [Paenibacillus agaridevorans]